jgi:hypothetical protein
MHLAQTTDRSVAPPAPGEFEVSLFGPGVGECAVVHVGDGEWIVVDSCVERSTGRPIAVDYLQRLGFDLKTAIKALVVTHWHDDHVRGISQLLEAAPAASVYCSAALNKTEFRRAVIAGSLGGDNESGVSEFDKVFSILQLRSKERKESISPKYAQEGTLIYRRPKLAVEVLALSPSPATMTLAMHNIATLLPDLVSLQPQSGRPRPRAVAMEPNKAAVVIAVQAGACHALLGADLESSPATNVGWQGVMAAECRPVTKAKLFKVPHHGGASADEPVVWRRCSQAVPSRSWPHIRVVAYRKLPTSEDCG